DDAVAAAIPAFLKSCGALAPRAETAPLDARTKSGDFGSAAEWRPLCAAAEQLPPGDDKAARQFFETSFVPWLAGNNGAAEGLFTGYFEISLNGSRRPGGAFRTPLYRRPPDPTRFTRAEIEDGALNGEGPVGAQRVVLTPERSLAVDRAFIPLGLPLWLEAQERFSAGKYRRLLITQDTGGAIKGPVRGDLFWGHGPAAAAGAGAMNARGHYYLLLPRAVAARLGQVATATAH